MKPGSEKSKAFTLFDALSLIMLVIIFAIAKRGTVS